MYLYDEATCTFIYNITTKTYQQNLYFIFLKLKLTVQLLYTGFKMQLTFASDTQHSLLTKTLSSVLAKTSHSNSLKSRTRFVVSTMVAPTLLLCIKIVL